MIYIVYVWIMLILMLNIVYKKCNNLLKLCLINHQVKIYHIIWCGYMNQWIEYIMIKDNKRKDYLNMVYYLDGDLQHGLIHH